LYRDSWIEIFFASTWSGIADRNFRFVGNVSSHLAFIFLHS
jgi:hypothetical protein